jgi:hypothetical protein
MLAALPFTRTTVRDLFSVRRMPIPDCLVASTVVTANGDGYSASALLAFSFSLLDPSHVIHYQVPYTGSRTGDFAIHLK